MFYIYGLPIAALLCYPGISPPGSKVRAGPDQGTEPFADKLRAVTETHGQEEAECTRSEVWPARPSPVDT
jgi:hypothetical protein